MGFVVWLCYGPNYHIQFYSNHDNITTRVAKISKERSKWNSAEIVDSLPSG